MFDRLCIPNDTRDGKGGYFDEHDLHESIARDLSRLFNTRSHLDIDSYCAAQRSVIDYGLPDVTALSPRSGDDLARLQCAVAHAIACFEPRLLHTRVRVSDASGQPHRAHLHIDAAVRLGSELRRVQFDLGTEIGGTEVGRHDARQ
jgi:type VI secretion system protein ImpF